MPFLTDEEIAKLEANPETAPLAKKLKEQHWIPKDRLDEVLNKKQELETRLQQIETEKNTAEQERLRQQGEFKTLAEQEKQKREQAESELAKEKAEADKYRGFIAGKRAKAKETLGDKWLPEYDTFSLESIEKILEMNGVQTPPGTITTPPGKPATGKKWHEMTLLEREQHLEKIKTQKV